VITFLTILGYTVLFTGVWVCGAAFVANYIERGYRHQGIRKEWIDDNWSAIAVFGWPLALPFYLPFKLAQWAGVKFWNRVHRAELIKRELANEQPPVMADWR
jgi:hypothetical protein